MRPLPATLAPTLLLALLALPCVAQTAAPTTAAPPDPVVARVVEGVILPRFDEFAAAAQELAVAAATDCRATGDALKPAWNRAMDAWIPAQTFRIGPLEADGRGLAIAFWPDSKGATDAALRRMLAGGAGQIPDAQGYAQVSVAARGLYALEAMLYDPDFSGYGPDDPGCRLVQSASAELAATAEAVARDWRDGFAPLLMQPGAAGNTRFLSTTEARQALFTQLITQLGFDAETRLGRPLGSIERPRPLRAESRDAGRSLRNVAISLMANEELARALTEGTTEYLFDYFGYARAVADKLAQDPVFAQVEDPVGRMKVEELKTAIERVHDDANSELGPELGVSAGFNALDGD